MKRTIRLIIALAIVMGTASSCKSKQQITEVPAGANAKATTAAKATTEQQAAVVETPAAPAQTLNSNSGYGQEPEVTRNENFTLVDGESTAFKNKYHVVVGSFSKPENARGLQSTLKSEGNSALVVKNEKGMYRVLIASFNDYYKAHDRIKQISGRFPDAWVLVQK